MQHRSTVLFACLGLLAAALAPARAAAPDELAAAVAAPSRTPRLVARDVVRHPAEELAFLGLRPDAHVIEIWPGGGYWTEILASYLAPHGALAVALMPADGGNEAAKFRTRFGSRPGFAAVAVSMLDRTRTVIAPPGSADVVLTFRNVHNWMADGYASEAFSGFYAALKPGGILGVEEHRGLDTVPQDPQAANGYVRQDYVIALAVKAGFELVGSSELLANPRDTKDYEKGVWTLPPEFTLKQVDRARYAAIGEADNMLLRFRKPLP